MVKKIIHLSLDWTRHRQSMKNIIPNLCVMIYLIELNSLPFNLI